MNSYEVETKVILSKLNNVAFRINGEYKSKSIRYVFDDVVRVVDGEYIPSILNNLSGYFRKNYNLICKAERIGFANEYRIDLCNYQ